MRMQQNQTGKRIQANLCIEFCTQITFFRTLLQLIKFLEKCLGEKQTVAKAVYMFSFFLTSPDTLPLSCAFNMQFLYFSTFIICVIAVVIIIQRDESQFINIIQLFRFYFVSQLSLNKQIFIIVINIVSKRISEVTTVHCFFLKNMFIYLFFLLLQLSET